MAAHEAQRVMQARTAIGALLASGAMLLVGPVSIAVADPAGDNVTSPTSVQDRIRTGPFSFGQTRAVVGQPRLHVRVADDMSEMESLRRQMAMDRLSKMTSTLSNLLKKTSDNTSSILANLK